jgi:hypothetical protein
MSPELEGGKGSEADSHVSAFKSYLQYGNHEEALREAEKLTEMECSVCESFGNHLYSLVIALKTSPSQEAAETLHEQAIASAEAMLSVVREQE